MSSKNHCFGLFCIKNTNKGQNRITTKTTFFRVAFLAFVCPVFSCVLCALVLSKSRGYMMESVSTDPPRWNVQVLGRRQKACRYSVQSMCSPLYGLQLRYKICNGEFLESFTLIVHRGV